MIALDVGCGTNRSYAFRTLIPKNYEAVFLDIEIPDKSLLRYGHWVVADAEHLPFRPSSFDLIVASHVIEHLSDWRRFLRECYNILRTSGELWIRCPNFMSVNARRDPRHKHVLNVIKLVREMRRIGYRVALEHTIGSMIPRPLRIPLQILFNLLCDEIRVRGIKPRSS